MSIGLETVRKSHGSRAAFHREPSILELDGQPLSLEEISGVSNDGWTVTLSADACQRMTASRRVVEAVVARGETAYGINTGFGKLAEMRIPLEQLVALQRNLVRSHAAGVGEPLAETEVRAMLLLRANVLAKGHSGVRVKVAELLAGMLNNGVHPVVPSRGSVGASGDLAPLAHLALALIGEGDVFFRGKRAPALIAMKATGLQPLVLEAKEGLALLNGTQAMVATGGLALMRGLRVARLFDLAGAMSLEALMGTPTPFDERIHQARPHAGQMAAAQHLRELLAESEIRESHRHNDTRVQDAYCLRCMPQVHGAAR
jgi:histidine ammonia-lyase